MQRDIGLAEKDTIAARAKRVRMAVLRAVGTAGSSHVGSALSCVDILSSLYSGVLRVDARNPDSPTRDRFIMSKAHAGIALYAILADVAFFPVDRLSSYYRDGGSLAGHSDAHEVPGIEVSTGSLGHGLALGTGMSLYAARRSLDWRTFVLLSDGECDEGSTWEAALLAAHHGLDHLVAIVDANGMQGMGATESIIKLEPLAAKWRAFNWGVVEVDGHDVTALSRTLTSLPIERGRPSVIIARTVKGKGVSFMENNNLWHYRTPAGDELARAIKELEQ